MGVLTPNVGPLSSTIYESAKWTAAGSFAALVLYTIWRCIYNIWFHPLARFPGPLICKISPIYPVLGLHKGRWPFIVKKLHDKYGPIIRLMPTELAFTDPQAWKDIYGHRQGHPQFHKDPIHVGSVQEIKGASTLTMAGDDEHARQRRALSHAFSQKALLEQESIIRGYVDLFIERLKPYAASGEKVDMCNWYNWTTFDIIGDMAFGEPFGCLRDGKEHTWVGLITETIKAGAFEQSTRRIFTTGSIWQKACKILIPQHLKEKRFLHLKLSMEKVQKRLDQGLRREHRDFLYYILRQNEKGSVSEAEIMLNSALFIVAGSETTASFLAGMTMWLMRTPRAYQRLTTEIRTTFKSVTDINFLDLQAMPYMQACIEEGLRIFPSIPTGLTRTVPKSGDTIAGEWIAGGTTVSVHSWAATHSERNWVRPEEYIPERWLAGEAQEFDKDLKEASQPFSLGPRGCIGRHLSYMELRLILASLLWHFDIERADLPGFDIWDPADNLSHVKAFNTWDKPPLWCKLTPVKRD